MAVTMTARSKSTSVVTVYRTMDGALHHARCGRRMTYQGTSASGFDLEFHCAICHERVVLPEHVAASVPVATSGAA